MANGKPDPRDSLFKKAFWVLKYRPAQFFSQARTYLSFWLARQGMRLFPIAGVELAANVRIQKRRTLLAEAPNAKIRIGAHTLIYENARLEAFGEGLIEIGGDSFIGDVRINCRGRISIGKCFLGSWGVFIQDSATHPTDAQQRALQSQISCRNFLPYWGDPRDRVLPALDWKPDPGVIEIGDNVWVGAQSTILKNARIGSGCIVATGSVVIAGDYPPNSLIAGNPARVVKSLTTKD